MRLFVYACIHIHIHVHVLYECSYMYMYVRYSVMIAAVESDLLDFHI